MGKLGDRLLDPDYIPIVEDNDPNKFVPTKFSYNRIIKCPVRFTTDLIEYCESKEFLNIKLYPLQKKFIEELFSTDYQGNSKYNEGVLCCGMRSGKSWTAAFIATGMLQILLQEEEVTSRFKLAKGTRITAQCLASSEVQSKETAFAAIKSIITYTDYWRKYKQYLLDREQNEGKETLFQDLQRTIEFKEKNLAIMSLNSSSSSLAGKSSFLVIMDELSRLATVDGALAGKSENRTAEAVYSTVSRSIMSLKGFGKVVTVSSPLYEDDYTMKLVKMAGKCDVGSQAYIINSLRAKEPKKISTIYALHATTYEFNPEITEADLLSEKEKNYFSYNRDYLAVPSSAINPFIEHSERINACINTVREPVVVFENKLIEEDIKSNNVFEKRTYIGKIAYPLEHDKTKKRYICCDQGEKKDSFVIAMGYIESFTVELPSADGKLNKVEKYKVIIDLIEEWKPDPKEKITVSFVNVEEILNILNQYFRIDSIMFDRWQSTEIIERLFRQGIHTERIGATIEMYDTLKMLIYANMIEFPNNDKLISELRQLNRVRSTSGHEKVDHPPESGKDAADAVCRVAWCVYNDSIKNAAQGNFMLPITQKFSTVRSAGAYFESLKRDAAADGVFAPSSSQNDIWGNSGGTFVQSNVKNITGKGFFK